MPTYLIQIKAPDGSYSPIREIEKPNDEEAEKEARYILERARAHGVKASGTRVFKLVIEI